MLPRSTFYRVAYGLLLTFLVIWVATKIPFLFRPFIVTFQTLFAPILISGLLYYLFRGLVDFLTGRKVPRPLAIITVFCAAGMTLTLLILFVAPLVKQQFTQLLESMPGFAEALVQRTNQLLTSGFLAGIFNRANLDTSEWSARLAEFLNLSFTAMSTRVMNLISFIINLFVIAVTVPFILYYFLKDGERMLQGILNIFPAAKRPRMQELLFKIDETVSLYIRGQMTVALCVGFLLLIGYLIVDMEYAFLLALFAMMTNVIPYIGAFIAAVPAVLVAFADSPGMVIKVVIITLIAQQIEGNIISPQIVGKQLEIHPLTIIVLLLVVGTLMGPLGMLLAVPVYAVIKIILVHLYEGSQLMRSRD